MAAIALAGQAGYPARVCDHGPFHLIEIWVDGCQMIEVLPPEMQAEYLGSMTLAGWEGFLAAATAAALGTRGRGFMGRDV